MLGIDVPENRALGIMNVTEGAHLGSDLGANLLGEWLFAGRHGLPKDPIRARFWLKKVVDGECTHKNLRDECLANAAQCLRELEPDGE